MHLSCLFCHSFRSWKSGQKDLLSFQRLVAQTLLLRHGTKPSRQGRKSSMAVEITDATRFDSANHWPCNTGSRYKWCKNVFRGSKKKLFVEVLSIKKIENKDTSSNCLLFWILYRGNLRPHLFVIIYYDYIIILLLLYYYYFSIIIIRWHLT